MRVSGELYTSRCINESNCCALQMGSLKIQIRFSTYNFNKQQTMKNISNPPNQFRCDITNINNLKFMNCLCSKI